MKPVEVKIADRVGAPYLRTPCLDSSATRALSVDNVAAQHDGSMTAEPGHDESQIVLVHPSRLFRECFKVALSSRLYCTFIEFENDVEVASLPKLRDNSILLFDLSAMSAEPDMQQVKTLVSDLGGRVPIIITGNSEDPEFILDLLKSGISGYFPMSLGVEVVLHALMLVKAGGVYAPLCCLTKLQRGCVAKPKETTDGEVLTAKQLSVVKAIRQGKPNKTIAYELNMCESTVKVHVRNIMKKLGARNRTQVAYIANQMLGDQTDA